MYIIYTYKNIHFTLLHETKTTKITAVSRQLENNYQKINTFVQTKTNLTTFFL